MASVRTVITGAMIVILTVALVSAITLSYLASERVLLNHAEQLTKQVATDTTAFTENFLDPADDAADLTQRLAESAIIRTDDPDLLARYFHQILLTRSDFSGIFFGGANGQFLFVSRDETVENAPFRVKHIRTQPTRDVKLTFHKQDFEAIETRKDNTDIYDPRTRPWYIASSQKGEITWTDPYIFFTSKRPGITVATPVFDQDGTIQGAVGIDIQIDTLSRFLSNMEIGERGGVAIISPNGDIVAHNDPSLVLSQSKETGQFRFAKYNEINDAGLAGAVAGLVGDASSPLAQLEPEQTTVKRFESGGEYWRGAVRRLRGGQTPWVVVTYLPESDILGPSKQARNLGYIISLIATLLSAVAAAIFAQRFSKPVRDLERQAKMISQGNFEDVELGPTRIQELDSTQTAFKRATHWLRDYKQRNDELTTKLRSSADALEGRVEERTRELSDVNEKLVNSSRRMRTLAGELKTRMKDIFATTSTLISISAREADNTHDMQQETEKRLHALALAHSATQSIESADLKALVESILEPFLVRSLDANISGEPVLVKANLVSPISMILYELATNAVKFGGLNEVGGAIQISWRLTGNGGLNLYWSERASEGAEAEPDFESEDRETMLLETMTEQLGASLTRKLTPDGMDIVLFVPDLIADEQDAA